MTEQRSTAATPPTLAARMLAVMGDVGYVQKRGQTDSGPRYSFIRHDDVVAAVRPVMVRHGVAFHSSVLADSLSCEPVGQTRGGATRFKTTLLLELVFISADDPGDTYTVTFPGEGIDTEDKGSGKALSYALKNGLLKTFMIESGDEADNEHGPQGDSEPQVTLLGAERWHDMLAAAVNMGASQERLLAEFSRHGYPNPALAPLDLAKQIYDVMRQALSERHDAERERAAEAGTATTTAPHVTTTVTVEAAPEAKAETITPTQAEQLRAALHARGYDARAVTGPLGVERLTEIPAAQWQRVNAAVAALPDAGAPPEPAPEPDGDPEPEPEPPATAPLPESAPEPAAAPVTDAERETVAREARRPDGCRLDASFMECAQVRRGEVPVCDDCEHYDAEFAPLDAATRRDERPPEHAPWGTVAKRGTIDAGRLKRLGMLCSKLEGYGVAEEQWREAVYAQEKVTSRKELSKAAADRVGKYLKRWLTDLESGMLAAEGEPGA